MSNRRLSLTTHHQDARGVSPWPRKIQLAIVVWEFFWPIFCQWTPKPFNRWRIFCLRLFGAKIYGNPFVHQRARIKLPWNLILRDDSTLGDRANVYTLGEVEVHERATVAQEAYLCSGTHDFADPMLPLQTAKIVVERDVFIGARAFVLPGVTIGEGAIVGACTVVTRDVEAGDIVAGNPARVIGKRDAKGTHSPNGFSKKHQLS